jgi:hypothetical protein
MEPPSASSNFSVSFVMDTFVAVADRVSTAEVFVPAIQQVLRVLFSARLIGQTGSVQ